MHHSGELGSQHAVSRKDIGAVEAAAAVGGQQESGCIAHTTDACANAQGGAAPLGGRGTRACTGVRRLDLEHCSTALQGEDAWTRNPRTEAHAVNTSGEKARAVGRAVASRGRHRACSSRRDRDAPSAAHTWAARRAPSASAGWGGGSRRAGGTARARPAAIVTRRLRYTHGPHARRTPSVRRRANNCVARVAQRVLFPPRS